MLLDAFANALHLIVTCDRDVVQYAVRSLGIALLATCICSIPAIPLGIAIAENEFRGKRILVTLLNTCMGVPTVIVGLFVYSLIRSSGPLGMLDLLFTVRGMIIGEVLLIFPLVTALTLAAVARTDADIRMTALSLGANRGQALRVVIMESRFALLAAVTAAFGRVIGEVGVAMILGGNADHFTRTLTTSIVLQIDMGRFEIALALGLVLLSLSLIVNAAFQLLQGGGRNR